MKHIKTINEFFLKPHFSFPPFLLQKVWRDGENLDNRENMLLTEVIEYISEEMGEELSEKEVLGSGFFGSVFPMKSGKVIKLTDDEYEIYDVWRLSKKPVTKYLVNYYDIRHIISKHFTSKIYAILMDKVIPLDKKPEHLKFKNGVWSALSDEFRFTNEDKLREWLNKSADDFVIFRNNGVWYYLNESEIEYLKSIWKDIQNIFKELIKYRLVEEVDFHFNNVGIIDEHLVFYDIRNQSVPTNYFKNKVKTIDISFIGE